VAIQARSALQQVVELLNTQTDGQYTFAGSDSTNPPIGSSLPTWAISAAGSVVVGLSTSTDPASVLGTLVVQVSTWNLASPGASLPTGAPPAAVRTQTGQDQTVPTAFVAGRNSFAPASADPTTGSYVGDLIAGLAGLASLASPTASPAALQSFGVAVSQLLQGAGTAMDTEEAGFGQVQAGLTTQGTALSETLTTLTTQVSGAENVDMAATATALSQVQTQLQASFQLIAGLKQLSLTTYL
jgi:flagellar hook-associated protein 3 FlgL